MIVESNDYAQAKDALLTNYIKLLDERKMDYDNKIIEAKEGMLDQLIKVIPRMQSVKPLAEALKIIHDIEKIKPQEDPSDDSPANLFQTIMNNIQNIEINNQNQEYNGEESD